MGTWNRLNYLSTEVRGEIHDLFSPSADLPITEATSVTNKVKVDLKYTFLFPLILQNWHSILYKSINIKQK